MVDLIPRKIVTELDRYIIGQGSAKKVVAIALRNRWRRLQLDESIKDEVLPKNILMIGPTGCGKTEISRRLAKLVNAPFIKVEATKFTEVGYVGRDVEQIIRDLIEIGVNLVKDVKRIELEKKARGLAEKRILKALLGNSPSEATYNDFRDKLYKGKLDDKEIELDLLQKNSNFPMLDIPNMPGASISAISIGDILPKGMLGEKTKTCKMTVAEAYEPLIAEEVEQMIDKNKIVKEAINRVENNGIVFIDEIDKICVRENRSGGDVSREGVQRDLLPLIEGTTVNTKYGSIKTDHILFITSGSFHASKPSDLLPELQGRLPIRVTLTPLSEKDFKKILLETEASLIKQYIALLATEGINIIFTDDAIDLIANTAANINSTIENIGARRLQTIMEAILSEISFNAPDMENKQVTIDAAYVDKHISKLTKDTNLSRFIL